MFNIAGTYENNLRVREFERLSDKGRLVQDNHLICPSRQYLFDDQGFQIIVETFHLHLEVSRTCSNPWPEFHFFHLSAAKKQVKVKKALVLSPFFHHSNQEKR
ncbi:hypothetical protein PsorP6_000743 [Peronosclerospora sorghi]|uniref:Uncharacterized protein n=1 Tax=Peronosclerospora sorghi TaxID=230839 RepID=A0ACC0WV38_9STRA|nr:hypothetical protein PsorP6_000743 [Peronosclerospora sorghi]